MHDVMMLILYGAMLAAVIVTFLRWGVVDHGCDAADAWNVHDAAGDAQAPEAASITAVDPTGVTPEEGELVDGLYAKAN